MKPLVVHSAAKVNLTLDVLSRRRDGYHDLQSVVHAIGLWDTLTFDFSTNIHHQTAITVGCNDASLSGEDNLCLKAARAWLEAAQNKGYTPLIRCHIQLEKRIPYGAGLGGGSGNAAATLLAFNQHHQNVLDESELRRVAAKIGADVPFFLRGGGALMEGIGDRLSPLPALEGWLVIVQSSQTLSTPAVFGIWDALEEPSQLATRQMLEAFDDDLNGIGTIMEEMEQGLSPRQSLVPPPLKSVARALGNDLEGAAQKLLPPLRDMAVLLRAHGALGAQMTGSGSAVFGLYESEKQASDAASRIRAQNGQSESILYLPTVTTAPFCLDAVRFEEDSQKIM